jgi:ABC-type nitrate/sulfonate/bicarbonate transport system permease component
MPTEDVHGVELARALLADVDDLPGRVRDGAVLATTVGLPFGLWMAYFSVANALSHVVMLFKLGYNPGFVVSLLVNIPVGIYTIVYFSAHDLVSPMVHVVSAAIGLAIQAALMIYGFGVLKPRLRKSASAVG